MLYLHLFHCRIYLQLFQYLDSIISFTDLCVFCSAISLNLWILGFIGCLQSAKAKSPLLLTIFLFPSLPKLYTKNVFCWPWAVLKTLSGVQEVKNIFIIIIWWLLNNHKDIIKEGVICFFNCVDICTDKAKVATGKTPSILVWINAVTPNCTCILCIFHYHTQEKRKKSNLTNKCNWWIRKVLFY